MPRIKPKRRKPKYDVYKQKLIAQAKKDQEFNRNLTLQKSRESFSLFYIQPEEFLGIKRQYYTYPTPDGSHAYI